MNASPVHTSTGRSMASQFATIGIFAKKNDDNVSRTLNTLIQDLLGRGKQVLLETEYATDRDDVDRCPHDQMGRACDLVVVIGGDGTLLDAGRAVASSNTPLLGINLGRLGFMVDVLPADMKTTLDDVFAGHFVAETRLMIEARLRRAGEALNDSPCTAINECVIRNQAFARVLDFDTYMNGAFISHHRADGMVVATPTGSTAYALSGGGPVLHPGLSALALVPICPHTLSDRPLIVDAHHEIEVQVARTLDGAALFTSDGQITQPLGAGDSVHIRRSPDDLHLIHPSGYDYFNILRNKLQWGRGQQAPRV